MDGVREGVKKGSSAVCILSFFPFKRGNRFSLLYTFVSLTLVLLPKKKKNQDTQKSI